MPLTLPSMTFVRDVTIGEGESVPPSTDFTKTWTVLNSGNEPWPEGTLFSCNICELPNYLQLKLVWTQYSNNINFLYISGCTLKFTQGNRMSDGRSTLSDRLEVGCLPPGEKIDISVSMRSPEQPGMYESQWRMATSTGKMCHV